MLTSSSQTLPVLQAGETWGHGAHTVAFVQWRSLCQWAIEKDKSKRVRLLSNEGQTQFLGFGGVMQTFGKPPS